MIVILCCASRAPADVRKIIRAVRSFPVTRREEKQISVTAIARSSPPRRYLSILHCTSIAMALSDCPASRYRGADMAGWGLEKTRSRVRNVERGNIQKVMAVTPAP